MKTYGLISLMLLAGVKLSAQDRPTSIRIPEAQRDSLQQAAGRPLTSTAPRLGGINVSGVLFPVSGNGKDFLIQQFSAEAGTPVRILKLKSNRPYFFRASLRYQGLYLSGEPFIGSNNFHSVTANLSYTTILSRSTHLSIFGLTGVASDFRKSITGSDLYYTVGARIALRQDKDFKYAINLVYTDMYTGSFLLPIPEFAWTINDKWSWTGFLPIRTSLKYKLSKQHQLGWTTTFQGATYRLNSGAGDEYIQHQQVSTGISYDWQLNHRWDLNIIGGYTLSNKLQTYSNSEKAGFNAFDKIQDRKWNLSYDRNTPFIQAGFNYKF
ncbi:MAG: DUF6268 family outer membrane beta-barrel protein [Candidatus Pseudobacter hemicellulosilyticus]|uniref:DUF6268 family outer membrane beta-barrel protein n=1 Tax=Candidatus Pseudobacter hemicellulosilyticus TaxID=3121375 RepID=A0AAJ5WPQ7_9BACT|nr:MAG: DUF6268 family outer membrane beta-barrel protein [Pseudobacter sp.]